MNIDNCVVEAISQCKSTAKGLSSIKIYFIFDYVIVSVGGSVHTRVGAHRGRERHPKLLVLNFYVALEPNSHLPEGPVLNH